MKTLITHWYIWVLAYMLGIIGMLVSVINDFDTLLSVSILFMSIGILMLVILLIAAIIIPKAQLTHKFDIIISITAGIIFFFVALFFAVIVTAAGQHHPPHYPEEEPALDIEYLELDERQDSVALLPNETRE